MTSYQYIMSIICIVIAMICLILSKVLANTIGKKFDSLLSERNIPFPVTTNFILSNSWGRANIYSVLIIAFKEPSKNESWRYRRFRELYRGFDFRAHASLKDIKLARLYLFFLGMGLIAVFIFLLPVLFK